MKIRLLHISDLHMVSAKESEAGEKFNRNLVFDSMAKFIKKKKIRADLVVLSGDAALKAKPAQYEECGRLCDKLLDALGLPGDRLFIAPGNHDLQRDRVTGVHRMLFRNIKNQADINDIFTDKDTFSTLLKKFENFNVFANRAMNRERFGEDGYWFSETLCVRDGAKGRIFERLEWFGPRKEKTGAEAGSGPDIEEEPSRAGDPDCLIIRMAALNSCLLAGYDGDERQRLALGIHQVKPAVACFGENDNENELRIGFFHHPFNYHIPADKNSRSKLAENFDLILTGHVHDPQNEAVSNLAGECVMIGAGAGYDHIEKLNSFNMIEIDAVSGSGSVESFKYLSDFDLWKHDDDVYPSSEDGVFRFTIKKFAEKGSGSVSPKPGKENPDNVSNFPAAIQPPPTDVPIDLKSLTESYLNRVMCDARLLTLEGVDHKAAVCSDGAALELNAVYTALMTESTEPMKPGEMAEDGTMQMAGRGEKPCLSVLEFVDARKQTALLGDPGSGKTTFLKFIAMCMAAELLGRTDTGLELLTRPMPGKDGKNLEERQKWRHGPLVPIRIELKEFAAKMPLDGEGAASDLWRFVEEDLRSAALSEFFPFLKNVFINEGGFLLLDGLDEVPDAENRRVRIKNVVADFIKAFPKSRVLVTSRPYAYQKQDWRVPGLSETVLAPFHEGQILCFVDKWYARAARIRRMKPEEAQAKAELLKRAILANDRLRELAVRPLLLTLMASLHAWRNGSLPEQRQELYGDTVDLLLDRWEEAKTVKKQDGEYKLIQPSLSEWLGTDKMKIREFINELAFNAHKNQSELTGTAEIKGGDLAAGLWELNENPDPGQNSARLIEFLSLRAGLLIPKGVKIYTFPHRTFQEYLAACHLTDQDFPDLAADLCRKDPDRWREACLLAGAKAASGTKSAIWNLAAALCYRKHDDPLAGLEDVWGAQMAARAILETADPEKANARNLLSLDNIKRWLVRILEGDELPAAERADAGNNLALLGEIRPEVTEVDRMLFCYVPPGPFIMGEGKSERIDESLDYPFWIGKYPVTNGQFDAFVRDGGYKNARFWTEAEKEGFGKEGKFKGKYDDTAWDKPYDSGFPFHLSSHPANGVSWFESLAFARWLRERWKDLFGKNFIVRPALSVEWEKAARGGVRIPKTPTALRADEIPGFHSGEVAFRKNPRPARKYPWGENEEDDRITPENANYSETGLNATTAAGCFRRGAGPHGCLDMSGNVWEWCMDEIGKGVRVLRGGSWVNEAAYCRAASRGVDVPSIRLRNIGFRLVLLEVGGRANQTGTARGDSRTAEPM